MHTIPLTKKSLLFLGSVFIANCKGSIIPEAYLRMTVPVEFIFV